MRLAAGDSLTDAAAAAGVSRRQAQRWRAEGLIDGPAAELRAAATVRAVGVLSDRAAGAALYLADAADGAVEATAARVAAARAVLSLVFGVQRDAAAMAIAAQGSGGGPREISFRYVDDWRGSGGVSEVVAELPEGVAQYDPNAGRGTPAMTPQRAAELLDRYDRQRSGPGTAVAAALDPAEA
jgi:hypothetical protein